MSAALSTATNTHTPEEAKVRTPRQRKVVQRFEAVPASCRAPAAAAGLPLRLPAAAGSPHQLPATPARGAGGMAAAGGARTPRRTPVKVREAGAVVAVWPGDGDAPFWLARVDSARRGAKGNKLPVTWLEPGGSGGGGWELGSKQAGGIDRAAVICTVREAGDCAWPKASDGGGFRLALTAADRAAVAAAAATATAAEDAACVAAAAGRVVVQVDGLPGSGKSYMCTRLAATSGVA